MASLLEKLKTAQIPDFSGKERVSPIGKVQYSLTKWVDSRLNTLFHCLCANVKPLRFLQYPCGELGAASVGFKSCARKWGAAEHHQCLHQSAWKLEGQVPEGHVSVFLFVLWSTRVSLPVVKSCASVNRKDSGSLDVSVNGLSISQTIAIKSDATGKPEASSASCSASVSSAKVKFHGGAR